MIDERLKKRLLRLYPFFSFDFDDQTNHVRVWFGERGRSVNEIFTDFTDGREAQLDRKHLQLSIARDLMEMYPHLFIFVDVGRHDIFLSVYVKREGERDSDIDNAVSLTDQDLHERLHNWEWEAIAAAREGWFFCTGHKKAEPFYNYDFSYSSGKYCKAFGKANPDFRQEAMIETYI